MIQVILMSEYTLRELQRILKVGQTSLKAQNNYKFSVKNVGVAVDRFLTDLQDILGALEAMPEIDNNIIYDIKWQVIEIKMMYDRLKYLYDSLTIHMKELNEYIEESEKDVYQAVNSESMFTDILPWDMKDESI